MRGIFRWLLVVATVLVLIVGIGCGDGIGGAVDNPKVIHRLSTTRPALGVSTTEVDSAGWGTGATACLEYRIASTARRCGPTRCRRKGNIMAGQQGTITLTGNLGMDPVSFSRDPNNPACSFNVGVSSGYFDQSAQAWRSRETVWIKVRAYRTLATNVMQSLHKGDAVVVTGALRMDRWTKDGVNRTAIVMDASAVGHESELWRIHVLQNEPCAAGEWGCGECRRGSRRRCRWAGLAAWASDPTRRRWMPQPRL